MSATLRATHTILVRGERIEEGATFTATDSEAADLLSLGRAEPADAATAARVQVRVLPRGNWCAAGQALPPLPVIADWNDVAAEPAARRNWTLRR